MKRREFIGLVGGAAAWPLATRAQQPAKMKRIAIVHPSDKVGNMTITGRRSFRSFFEAMTKLGYIEGQNLLVERYSGEGRPDQYAKLALDVISTHPDLVVAYGSILAAHFKTIPVVATTSDPIAAGLVPSLAHPGVNITGVSVDAGSQIWGKRLGLLKEALPRLSNARFLATQLAWDRVEGPAVREAANQARISVAGALLSSSINEAAYERAFTSMKQDQVDALMVSSESVHLTNRMPIIDLAAKNHIPAIYPYRDFTEVGGLLAYSVDLEEIGRLLASSVDKVLKGTNPGNIPINQVTRYELALNLKTAKSLGIEFPATLLGSADLVVE